MSQINIEKISKELKISEHSVTNTLNLLDEGATIPFIARYRKEMTNSLDEIQIDNIKKLQQKYQELDKRRKAILESIAKQDKLTDELKAKINKVDNLNELEDLYLPYKPKRLTRAKIAKEKGLEPLAKIVMKQNSRNLEQAIESYLNDEVEDKEQALQGARDIIAEWINENEIARSIVRNQFQYNAVIYSKLVKSKEEEAVKFKDYFDFEEKLSRIASHRLLAILRGEKEGFLKISIKIDQELAEEKLDRLFVKADNESSEEVQKAITDAYKRLMSSSMESEFKKQAKEKADKQAIDVFGKNLNQLLLASPLGQKRILAIDPGYRTGCKIVCLDSHGSLLHNETIYPHPPQKQTKLAAKKITSLVEMYKIEAISIGNGTASRETESFITNLHFDRKLQVFVVSEAGASIYSASKIAREEFPEYDVTVRGAVSIGRRLMDPLAELVKIEPKSIGVGQYQHDVDQNLLKENLDTVVGSCVNKVGVDLNTASKHILTYISGLGPQLAQNIVNFREENGSFHSRKQLMKVPRMGAKAFEQSAGFMRISDAKNPLDNSAVHPESYYIVEKIASDLDLSISEIIANKEIIKTIKAENYIDDKFGLPSLKDILSELEKPSRDPRTAVKAFKFKDGIYSIDHLELGMELPGIVTNITNFGAFVDVGVKQDGLVHISQLANKFISDPSEVVVLNQHVMVKVIEVDKLRKRIQLSMKECSQ
ncbi:MAG: RNA-binding transcriptional accessory protein [Marinifilaceae bacterium]|jgi:uncharacterized protein|nr:RNA-binding transcriptional accessory protein [Marinifilaceae bacterium]